MANAQDPSSLRLKQNLIRLREVRIRIVIDITDADTAFLEAARVAFESAVSAILLRNGIRSRDAKEIPELETSVSIRPVRETTSTYGVAEYRVETILREMVTISRLSEGSRKADTWRHHADIRYAALAAGGESEPVILNEVKRQIEEFVSDWRVANGFPDEDAARGKGRDNLKGLLETVGPVFEKILNNLGIQTLIDLVDLEKDSDEEYIVLQELKARSPNFTDEKLKEWIAAAKKLLPPT